jgi:hypothetical protein
MASFSAAVADESASDISMAAESDAEDDSIDSIEAAEQLSSHAHASNGLEDFTNPVSKKRKSMDMLPDLPVSNGNPPGLPKRVKLGCGSTGQPPFLQAPQDRSLLPPEIWHHIFTFLPPKQLGNLLSVNKLFNCYLEPSPSPASQPLSQPIPQRPNACLKPDAIWQSSRRLFWPRMPSPLKELSERDMWRLVCSRSCQFCGRKGEKEVGVGDPWHAGPGLNGIATVFPFAITTCGQCLLQGTTKVRELALLGTGPLN